MNKAKEKFNEGKKLIGTFFELGGEASVEAAAIGGLDYIIIDTEHGPFDVESALTFVRTAELRDLTPFVRIKEVSRAAVLKMLDIGAKALIVPCVETVEQVENLVKWGKYTPVGERGFFFGRKAGYGFDEVAGDLQSYMNAMNEDTWIIPQCETQGALDNIETIVNIEGVDGIFVGPFDLSIGMGIPGQFQHEKFLEALDRVKKACHEAGKPVIMFAVDAESGKQYLDEGFDGVAISFDGDILIRAYQQMMEQLNS